MSLDTRTQGPVSVALHVTQFCAHACPMCYFSAGDQAPHAETSQLLRVLDSLAGTSVKEVIFLGGDPAEHPEILRLCARAHQVGLQTLILSNTHAYLERDPLMGARLVDVFETTIHGPTSEVHDAFAGSDGAFNRVVGNLQRVANSGKSIGVAYNAIPESAARLYETITALKNGHALPVDHVLIQRIIPSGRARDSARYTLSHNDVLRLFEDIERLSSDYGIAVSCEDAFPYCTVPSRFHKYLKPCVWGSTHGSLDASGNLTRCGATTAYNLGNVLLKSVDDIWATSAQLTSFRQLQHLSASCARCHLVDECRGGCSLSCSAGVERNDYLARYIPTKGAAPEDFRSSVARVSELQDILRIEWACFPHYVDKFSLTDLEHWWGLMPEIFTVWKDSFGDVVGYAATVPLARSGLQRLISEPGVSSLAHLSDDDVQVGAESAPDAIHVEVIATLPGVPKAARSAVIKYLSTQLESLRIPVTCTPITDAGVSLASRAGLLPVPEKPAVWTSPLGSRHE